MNLFGVGLGFLQPSIMVEESPHIADVEADLTLFYTSRLAMRYLFVKKHGLSLSLSFNFLEYDDD